MRNCVILACSLLVIPAFAAEPAWKPAEAAKYLDSRQKAWFDFSSARRGEAETQSTCVSCHTAVHYAFARPLLNKGESGEHEKKLLAHITMRVENWSDLDSKKFGLMYDFNDEKKQQSRGTEAVNSALILALDDRNHQRAAPGEITKKAFANLWQTQLADGKLKGSWDWLNFGFEPWESKNSRYYGACLAAIAIGTAPGYYKAGADVALDAKVESLRGYLKAGFDKENIYNRAWALWASQLLDGILSQTQQKEVAKQLLALQREDGGWNLPTLGGYKRVDKSEQVTASDGYATGLVLHILLIAGTSKDDAKILSGLAWLKANQLPTGAWRGTSVNKKRDPASHVGLFMSDAATAFAVLALNH